MEFSNNIDWKRHDAETMTLCNWTLTDEVFKNHSLQKYFDNDDLKKKSKTNHKQDKNTPKVSNMLPKLPEPLIPYPRISDLSIEDQKYFLDTYKEYISGKEMGSENLNQLQSLMWKLSSEQEEFLKFLQQHSLSAKDQYNFLHPQVKKEIANIFQTLRCRQVTENLAPHYTLFQTVGLSSGAVFPNDPILSYKQTLKQAIGQSLLSLPDMKTKHKSLFESNETDISLHCQLYEDSTACDLAGENAAHFVITAEALQTLIDNHSPEYEKDWELPVNVIDQLKESNKAIPESNKCSKIVMIDDPLPPKAMKPRETNAMFYRSKVCDILRKPRDTDQSVSTDICNSKTTVEKGNELQEAMVIDTDLTICEDNLKASVENRGKDFDKDYGNTAENGIHKEGMSVDSDCQSKDCDRINQAVSQFTYSLWTFGSLNLLIRTTDCGLLYQSNKTGKGSLHSVNVFVKPEYQLTYGYEQITTSEASRWWVNTYINPDSLCICARINPITAQLLKLDVLNQSNILTLSSFDPAKPMKMIHGILTRLEKLLRSGKYILSHSSNDMHICVYEVMHGEKGGKAKKASYDLHLAHSKEVLVEYEKYVPWVPIDPNVFLDWHIAYHRLPLTFPPVLKDELKKMQARNANVGKKKSKKGKKGKKIKTIGAKGSGVNVENKPLMKSFINSQTSDQSIQSDKQAVNEEDIGIAQRLRSRARPVTYDDIDFDF